MIPTDEKTFYNEFTWKKELIKTFLTRTLISVSSVHKIRQSQNICHTEMLFKDWTIASFKKCH